MIKAKMLTLRNRQFAKVCQRLRKRYCKDSEYYAEVGRRIEVIRVSVQSGVRIEDAIVANSRVSKSKRRKKDDQASS